MPERVFNAAIPGDIEFLYRRVILGRHRELDDPRSVAKAVRIATRDERIVSIEVAPLCAVKGRDTVAEIALMIPLRRQFGIEYSLRVKRRILDDEQPVERLMGVVCHTVPFFGRRIVAFAGIVPEVRAAD